MEETFNTDPADLVLYKQIVTRLGGPARATKLQPKRILDMGTSPETIRDEVHSSMERACFVL